MQDAPTYAHDEHIRTWRRSVRSSRRQAAYAEGHTFSFIVRDPGADSPCGKAPPAAGLLARLETGLCVGGHLRRGHGRPRRAAPCGPASSVEARRSSILAGLVACATTMSPARPLPPLRAHRLLSNADARSVQGKPGNLEPSRVRSVLARQGRRNGMLLGP